MISSREFRESCIRTLNEAIIKGFRPGQHVYNSLNAIRPDIAREIANDIVADPFYNDANLAAFWKKVEELW